MLSHFLIENDEPYRVVLVRSQVSQRRGEKLRILKLSHGAGAVTHRRTRIQKYHEVRVRLAEEPFDISAFGAGVDIPIDEPRVVAFSVGAILRELLAETEERRTMQAVQKTIHSRSRHEFQVGKTREYLRVEEISWRSSGSRTHRLRDAALTGLGLLARGAQRFYQLLQDVIHIDAIGLGEIVREHPMPQHGQDE